jgi:hypothetical protein
MFKKTVNICYIIGPIKIWSKNDSGKIGSKYNSEIEQHILIKQHNKSQR